MNQKELRKLLNLKNKYVVALQHSEKALKQESKTTQEDGKKEDIQRLLGYTIYLERINIFRNIIADLENVSKSIIIKDRKEIGRCVCGHSVSKHIKAANDEDTLYFDCKILGCDCVEYGEEDEV